MGVSGTALDELAWSLCAARRAAWWEATPASNHQLVPSPREEGRVAPFVPAGTPPRYCEECGGAYPLSKPPDFIVDMSQRWLCAGCCLREDADANPFQFMKGNLEQVWLSQARLFATHGALPALTTRRRPLPPGRQPVVVLWDPQDVGCQIVGNALDFAFGDQVRFVDVRDTVAAQEALRTHPGILPEDVCKAGAMSAIFPSGCWMSDCQTHPKVLLYELKYMRTVRAANLERVLAVEFEYAKALQDLRRELGGAPRWWLDPRALALISGSLERESYAVVDNFLQDHEWRAIKAQAMQINSAGQMEPGRKKGTSHNMGVEEDLMNRNDRPLKWTMLDDNIAYCGDGDPRAPGVRVDSAARDALVTALRAGGAGVRPAVASRLARVDLREKAMVTLYRASSRGRYQQHVDSHDARFRRLSTLLYFNEGWEAGDGGENRLFTEGALSVQVKVDTAPTANRLLVFWAEDDCPHEVLHTQRDRYASTIWYADADGLVDDMTGDGPRGLTQRLAEDHMKVVGHLQSSFPVAPLRFVDAMLRAGLPGGEAQRLHAVHAFLAYDRRPPHWISWDDGKRALQGSDARISELLPGLQPDDTAGRVTT